MNEKFLQKIENQVPWLPPEVLKLILTLIILFTAYFLIRKIINRSLRIRPGGLNEILSKHTDEQRVKTLRGIALFTLKLIFSVLFIVVILSFIGIDIGALMAGAGVVGLAISFGSQSLIKDVIAGLFVLIENQYRVGDVIRIDGTEGRVDEISLRKTTLRDMDGTVHHIPHGVVQFVSNLSLEFSKINLEIGISYNSDLEKVIGVVNSVGESLTTDPEWKEHILLAPQFLRVQDFADSSVIIKIIGETAPGMQWAVAGEFRKRLKIAFDKAGIEIPFPQLVVHQAK